MEVPRQREGLHVRKIDGQTVVLDPESGRMHTLNPAAAMVFESIDGHRTEAQISECLTAGFDVAPETAARDTRCTIDQFRELRLVL